MDTQVNTTRIIICDVNDVAADLVSRWLALSNGDNEEKICKKEWCLYRNRFEKKQINRRNKKQNRRNFI